jgi:hypothetical protein
MSAHGCSIGARAFFGWNAKFPVLCSRGVRTQECPLFLMRFSAGTAPSLRSEAGTTRDVIEEDFDLAGTRWKSVDTAGLRDTAAYTEAQGIAIARRYLRNAAIWLLVVDGTHGLSRRRPPVAARV